MLWILIVSLPAQGIAASVTLPCTMAHVSIASQHVDVMYDCDEPEMMMAKAPSHASKAFAHDGIDMPCDNGSDQKHSSCRAWAACCVRASAPPPFKMSIPSMEHSRTATRPQPLLLRAGFHPASNGRRACNSQLADFIRLKGVVRNMQAFIVRRLLYSHSIKQHTYAWPGVILS